MNEVITRKSMRDALVKAVEAKGADYVYGRVGRDGIPYHQECLYRYDGQPSCLFGHAFDILGVPYSKHWENVMVGNLLPRLGVGDVLLVEACQAAQSVQDIGGTWGEALSAFLDTIGAEVESKTESLVTA